MSREREFEPPNSQREFEPPISQSISKEKSGTIANIGVQSYITKFSPNCFILSVYYAGLH